jgi:DNA processing protein
LAEEFASPPQAAGSVAVEPSQRELAALRLAAPASRRLFHALFQKSGGARGLVDASFSWLLRTCPTLGEMGARALAGALDHPALDDELALAESLGVRWVALGDPGYPPNLADAPCPPPILCVRSGVAEETRPGVGEWTRAAVAIVGSRKATSYGLAISRNLGQGLAGAGVTVISGMAMGNDLEAMIGAAKANGCVVGVLGCGLATIHPPSAEPYVDWFLETGGALVSEYSLRAEPIPEHFPERNSIIAGMALGTCVVEAAQRSGSLITARHALEFNRSVYAVPGDITRAGSRGTNLLIREGAQLILSARDILEDLAPRLRQIANERLENDGAAPVRVSASLNLSALATETEAAPLSSANESGSEEGAATEPTRLPSPKTLQPRPVEKPLLPSPSAPSDRSAAPKSLNFSMEPPRPLAPREDGVQQELLTDGAALLSAETEGLSEFSQVVFQSLTAAPTTWDDLLRRFGSNQGESALSLALLDLEIEGLVRQLPGKLYVRT